MSNRGKLCVAPLAYDHCPTIPHAWVVGNVGEEPLCQCDTREKAEQVLGHILLLRAVSGDLVQIWTDLPKTGSILVEILGGKDYPTVPDAFGCPILTPEIREAMEKLETRP